MDFIVGLVEQFALHVWHMHTFMHTCATHSFIGEELKSHREIEDQ